MKKLLEWIEEEVAQAFEDAGYDRALGVVTPSNRRDLCEFQCNGAMAGAKKYHKAPLQIAEEVASKLQNSEILEKAEPVKPGFLNLTLKPETIRKYVVEMMHAKHFGAGESTPDQTIVIDYGGPNVAKPLHVGHLRAAIIGESLKRIFRYTGNKVIGDIHMGDWGLQMGLILTELKRRQPDLPYFDPSYTGEYPKEAPFTISELEEIYPTASAKSKEDEAYRAEAMEDTRKLQNGERGLRALWHHIVNVSVADIKRNYDLLNVDFDLWWGESTVNDIIAPMIEDMKQRGYAKESQGALVVDVSEETDKKEVPPCMLLKSDGAALYTTTDLATIQKRMDDFHPDEIVYVVDKRQDLHFIQCFRTARKTKMVLPETVLIFVGFGTMNGKDGKPYKTREGGVPRLEVLIGDTEEKMYERVKEANPDMEEEKARETAHKIAVAAIKYGDLSNQPSKDYVFDLDKFTSFEGDTGPYILYTMVRIKSILAKYEAEGKKAKDAKLASAGSKEEKALALELCTFADSVEEARKTYAPTRVCAYIYGLCNTFNSFYHQTHILKESDPEKKESYIALLYITWQVLEAAADLLGFEAPEAM